MGCIFSFFLFFLSWVVFGCRFVFFWVGMCHVFLFFCYGVWYVGTVFHCVYYSLGAHHASGDGT